MAFAQQYPATPHRASAAVLQQDIETFKEFNQLSPFLNALPTACVVLNPQRQIVFANRALLEFVAKADAESVYGQRPGEVLNCMHATHSPGGCGMSPFCRACGALNTILASLNGVRATEECHIMQADGTALDLRAWGTPLELKDKQYSIFAVEDISAEKRRQALERIFFHDLMNTAGAMAGFASALREGLLKPTVNYHDMLYRQARRLIAEIEAQRDLLAAEKHELTARPITANSLHILNEAHLASQYYDTTNECTVVVDPDAQDIVFDTDPTLMGRVLNNMVKNAMEAVSCEATITLDCRLVNDHVMFSVHNPGEMPEDVQLQVFKRSFSTKGNGRGLGTYSMKLLTERYLGGRVMFESSKEKGTLFRSLYPLKWRGDAKP